ncbi:complement C1q subcomponent subunit B-like isoform X2 [Mytilus trossulus]|uniref:complement C1q subcomponent subunit B-like isoform X2 n=1 Tax=Mytilus trossulus TaxID=6551 RepID=UPI003005ADEC
MGRIETFWTKNRTLVYTVSGLMLGYSFAMGMSYLLFSIGQKNGKGHIQSFAVSKQGIIAFYAVSTKDLDLEFSQTIVFDHVYTNIGKSYNPKTGKFMVPLNGLYRFGSTGMSQSKDIVHLQMNKNGVEVARSTAQQNHNTADMEAILELKKGDIIDVTRRTNNNKQTERLHGNRLASFTGFLITTM